MALKFRRGTTAQQSGSLQFGEPYVNSTLGTLVIGGPTGDIVLSSGGTGSTGNFGPISGSGLDITGNAKIAGNLTLGGNITIGDQTSDSVSVVASLSSSLIPSNDNTFDLGSATKMWRDLYISTASIKMVDPTTNQVVTTINAIAGGGIQIGNIQITTGSINVVDNNGAVTQQVANSSSAGVSQIYTTTGSFNTYTQSANTNITTNSASAAGAFASASAYSGSFYTTINTNIGNITTNSASAAGAFASASAYSGSFYTTINTNIGNITTNSASAAGAFASASAFSSSFASKVGQSLNTTDNVQFNTITANQYNVTTISSSVLFTSGSTKFGNTSDDTMSVTGSLGVTGSIGVVGDLTINGTSYSAATSGTNGAQGPQGTNGTIGVNGNQGPTGPQGVQGTQGTQGTQGFQGRQGDLGPTGPQGRQGPSGTNGSNGGTGPTGPTGPSGNPFGGGTFTGGIAVQGAITATGDITAYSSDDRLKVRIGNIENALSKVQQLNGFHYTNSDVAKSLGYTTDESQVGVSAQEVQEVLPEVVVLAPIDRLVLESGEIISKSGENYLTVKYEKIVPLIIEAIKELKAELDELKSK